MCANDELALSIMSRLQDAGRDVPGSIAVVGWDDVMTSRYVRPGMTTVRQPVHELGVLAAERLHQRVDGAGCPARSRRAADRGRAARLVRLLHPVGTRSGRDQPAAPVSPDTIPDPHPDPTDQPLPGPRTPSRHPQKVRHPMRRTTAITVACMTAAALTVTACGRGAETEGSSAGQTGAAVNTGAATGTITASAGPQ